MTAVTGSYVEGATSGTAFSFTVPTGVVPAMKAIIVVATGSSAAQSSITLTKTGATFTRVGLTQATNEWTAVFEGTGLTAGDTVNVGLTSNATVSIGHYYTDEWDPDATLGTPGTRGGTSQATTTSGSLSVTAGQRVFVVATERTTSATTVSSVVSSGGESVTQISFGEGATVQTSVFLGYFTAGSTGSRTVTITYSNSSGNGYCALWGAAATTPGGGGGGTTSGGSGGPLTDRTSVSYTNPTGTTSTGHIYAAGLDWTKPVGIMVYTDGSGEYGLKNPTDNYLLAGANGLVAIAKKHNMVLVTPLAPGDGCTDGDGTCWYMSSFDGTSDTTKAKWADDFVKTQVLQKYNIDQSRAVIAGYSSGAEFTMGLYGPGYAASWMQDGLLLAISYGSPPWVTSTYTAGFKQNVAAVWDIGAADTTGAMTDGTAGYNWYVSNGFATTAKITPAGVTHSRGGTFGGIVDTYVTQYVTPASTSGGGGPFLPTDILRLKASGGNNHFNCGIGYVSGHVDKTPAQLEAGFDEDPYFHAKTNVDGLWCVQYHAPLDGATTSSGTEYARSELREMQQGATDNTPKMSFDPKTGEHWIEAWIRVTSLPPNKPQVCVMQAHDPNDDTIMILTQKVNGVLTLRLRYNGSDSGLPVLDSNYVVGREFYLKIRLLNGTTQVYYYCPATGSGSTSTPISTTTTFSSAGTGWYYKAGCYNQSNETIDSTGMFKVEQRDLRHWHTGWTSPLPPWSTTQNATPTVDAGTNASIEAGSVFTRTATETGSFTSRAWKVISGPSGAGSTLSTAPALNWTPTTQGTYVLGYYGYYSGGTAYDEVTVTVTAPVGGGGSGDVWPEEFPDGTAYDEIYGGQNIVNVSTSAQLTTALAGAKAGDRIRLASGSYTGSFTLSAKQGSQAVGSGITIESATVGGATFTAGSTLTVTSCREVIVAGLVFGWEGTGGNQHVKIAGSSNRVRVTRCTFGPPGSGTPTGSTDTWNYVYAGDQSSHLRIDHNEFRRKGTGGNAVRVYGDFDTNIGSPYVRVDHNLFRDIGPQTENDKEPIRLGVSDMSRTDGHHVVERNVFVNCTSEPELTSIKMGDCRVSGNIYVNCAGSAVIRHGRNSIIADNYFIDSIGVTASAGMRSGGARMYDSGHTIRNNYMSGLQGANFQAPLLIDTGDAEGSSTNLAGHWRVIDATVQWNFIVDCAEGIQIGDNYSTNPANCVVTDNLVSRCTSGAALTYVGGTVVDTIDTGALQTSITRNTYAASPDLHGAAQDTAGIWRKAGYGPRVAYLTPAEVGPGGDTGDTDGTGTGPGSSGGGGIPTVPVVNVGADVTIEAGQTLVRSATEAGSAIFARTWTLVSGPSGGSADTTTAAGANNWGVPHVLSDEFGYSGPPDPTKWLVGSGAGVFGQLAASQVNVDGSKLTITGATGNPLTGQLMHRWQTPSDFASRGGRWEARLRSFYPSGPPSGGTAPTQTLGVGGVATPAGAHVETGNRGAFTISSGGSPGNPVVYDGKGFTSGRITINANYVTVQNYRVNADGQYGIYALGNGNTIQNNEIYNVHAPGDLNAITLFGSDCTIAFNKTPRDWISGDPGDSHTDCIQIWDTTSKIPTSRLLVYGNYFDGRLQSEGPPIHQGLMAEGPASTDGGGGGSGPMQDWHVEGNYWRDDWNQCLKFDDIDNVTITRNTFAGASDRIVEATSLSANVKFYSDNQITGSYGQVGISTTGGAGPANPYASRLSGSGATTAPSPYHPLVRVWPNDGSSWPRGGDYTLLDADHPGPSSAVAHLHYPSLDGQDSLIDPTPFPVDWTQFHNLAFEWTAAGLKSWIDGQLWYGPLSGGASSVRKALQDMTVGRGGLWLDADQASNMWASAMEVDWFRVYDLSTAGTVTPAPAAELSTGTATLVWQAPATLGDYVIRYTAENSAGIGSDQLTVHVVAPGSTTPGTGSETPPVFLGVGANAQSGKQATVDPSPVTGAKAGDFEIIVILSAGDETMTGVPAGWQLLDSAAVTSSTAPVDLGGPCTAWIYYTTTRCGQPDPFTKSGTRFVHAVRAAWRGHSSLGQHGVVVEATGSSGLTHNLYGASAVRDKSMAVGVIISDLINSSAGPYQSPAGWTGRYDATKTSATENESIAIADSLVAPGIVHGTFGSTNADECAVFTFILEGPSTANYNLTDFDSAHARDDERVVITVDIPPQTKSTTDLASTVEGEALRVFLSDADTGFGVETPGANAPAGLAALEWITYDVTGGKLAALLDAAPAVVWEARDPELTVALVGSATLTWEALEPTGGKSGGVITPIPPAPPRTRPRVLAQAILDGRWLAMELPLSDPEVTWALSGATRITGAFTPEMPTLADLGLEPWGSWIYLEEDGEIRAAGILQPVQIDPDGKMSLSAIGPHGYAKRVPYRSRYSGIGVDPADVVRVMWDHIQAFPRGDLGLTVEGSTPITIGTEPRDVEFVTGEGEQVSFTAGPYTLDYWQNTLVGSEVEKLGADTPFDFLENCRWRDSSRTDVQKWLSIHYPSVGERRTDLRFAQGENIIEFAPVEEPDDAYADVVYVQGKGEGIDKIQAEMETYVGGRIRLPAIVDDKTIDSVQRARTVAADELAARLASLVEVPEIVCDARHRNAPIGSFVPGDDLYVQVIYPYVGVIAAWHRCTAITYLPWSSRMKLSLTRRGEFRQ